MRLDNFLEIKSYDYDFKNEAPTDKVRNEKSPVKKYFEYRLNDPKFDCDRCELAKEVYMKLWGLSKAELGSYDSDTMNSFYRLYRLLLIAYDNSLGSNYWSGVAVKAGVKDYPTRFRWLLRDDVYEHYKAINENESVKKFASLTHSIGNFTLVPKGFNKVRNRLVDDYWDLTLQYFKDDLGEDAFANLAEKYVYEDYLNGKNVKLYWENHSLAKKELPSDFSYESIISIMENINRLIEVRGRSMMNVLKTGNCEKNNRIF